MNSDHVPEINQLCKAPLQDEFHRISHLISKVERLNEKCEDNMKRLNAMMLELKGIIAMVRPMAKKNEWYGEEINTEQSKLIPHPMPNEIKKIFCPNDFYINPDPRKD